MVLPTTITPPDTKDPLILYPIPAQLPPSPAPALASLLASFQPLLDTKGTLDNADKISTPPSPLLTTQMRAINRHSHMLLNAARAETAQARYDLDQADTALRGVEYERARVLDEIAKCEEYM